MSLPFDLQITRYGAEGSQSHWLRNIGTSECDTQPMPIPGSVPHQDRRAPGVIGADGPTLMRGSSGGFDEWQPGLCSAAGWIEHPVIHDRPKKPALLTRGELGFSAIDEEQLVYEDIDSLWRVGS